MTLVAGSVTNQADDAAMTYLEEGFIAWQKMSFALATSDYNQVTNAFALVDSAQRPQAADFMTKHVHNAWGRCLFTTKKIGAMGLCPQMARRKDLVVFLHGARTPYIIRPRRNGKFRFVGECYLHGFMYGNAMNRDEARVVVDFKLT